MRRRSRRPRIERVAIVAKLSPPENARLAAEVSTWLEGRGVSTRLDVDTSRAIGRKDGFPRSSLPPRTDLLVVAGGDGTLLSMARVAAPRRVPILGVNLGGLGFLTELHPDEIYSGLERVLRGDFAIEQRQTLRLRFRRRRATAGEFALLNDAVITKAALARMITIELRADGREVARYTSDGLIVATPTGSTAYNLSAGGPILDPRMRAFVIAPICPHTLTYRPLVVPADVRLEATLESVHEEAYLTLDGQVGFPMSTGDSITVDDHPSPLRLVRVAGRTFFEVLRRKLRWGER
jgi:NAD+ kinase